MVFSHNFSSAEGKSREAIIQNLKDFFMGKWYPVCVALLVLVGHSTGLEFYFNIPNVLMFCLALWLCDSARVAIIFACTVVFQVSRQNSPGVPSFSNYYFNSFRLAIIIILVSVIVVSLVRFIIANRLYSGLSMRKTPLLFALSLLSLGFILNGAFSPDWVIQDLVYGIVEAVCYFFIFIFFYTGFKKENPSELVRYLTYVSALIAMLLVLQVAHLYISTEGLFHEGSVIKEKILFGWGIWNTAGACLTVLIPMCFLGVMNSKHPVLYFAAATLTLFAAILTLSRNAILFGTLFYFVCLLICIFKGRKKRLLWVAALCFVALGAAFTVLAWDKISALLADVINRGFSDNGRFDLWRAGIQNFLKAPLFGSGFFALANDEFITTNFTPELAHQTFVELLGAAGVVGLLCYLAYRAFTLVPFIKRPSLVKTMLLLSILVLLAESLIDNFIFHFHHTFHYSITLAVAFRLYENEEKEFVLSSQ